MRHFTDIATYRLNGPRDPCSKHLIIKTCIYTILFLLWHLLEKRAMVLALPRPFQCQNYIYTNEIFSGKN